MDDAIYKAGYHSFLIGGGHRNNPYPINSDEYNWFERGWLQALKRSDTTSMQSSSVTIAISDNSFKSKYSEISERKKHSPVVESSYNAYAAAKGKD